MSDAYGPGASFGVAPVTPAPLVEQSAVPEAARAALKDRLKKREVKRALAVLDDETTVLVTGLRSRQMDAIRALAQQDEEEGTETSVTTTQAQMFRLMCTDPETGEKVFEDWSDEDFAEFPLADATIIMQAIAVVNGKTSAPGKGSPSTGDADSSSQ